MKKISKIIFAAVFSTALVVGADPVFAAKDKAAKEKPAKEKAAKPAKAKKPKKVKFDEAGYREAIINGDYDTAYGMLTGVPEASMTTAQKMDLAMFMHHAGDYAAAAEKMEKASSDFDGVIGADPTELFKIHAAEKEYCGSLYEYMLIDAFNALNYYKAGDLESAYSRVVKVGDKQRQYMANPKITGPDGIIAQEVSPKTEEATVSDTTKKVIAGVFGTLGLDSSSLIASMDTMVLPKKADPANDIYRSSAFADYLQIVLAAQNGSNVDDYIVNELNKIKKDNVETDSANLPSSKGRIEVLALTGYINQKQQDAMIADLTTTFAPVLGGDVVAKMNEMDVKVSYNFYYPKYVATPEDKVIKVTKVSLSNGDSKDAVLLEDFDVAVMQDINLKARRTAQRNVAADVSAKTPLFPVQLVTIPTLYAAAPLPKLQEGVINKVAGGLNDADPKADVRQSMALPSKAYCAGFTVEPGKYTVTVEYSNGKTTTEEVEVVAGKPVLVESLCK